MKKTIIITNCTLKKDNSPGEIPAWKRYYASPMFKVIWNAIKTLPVKKMIISAKFGLIDSETLIPNYNYKMQKSDVEKFVTECREKLKRENPDKIFVYTLGLYRKVFEKLKDEFNIDFAPKIEWSNGRKLDMIEFIKQAKRFSNYVKSFLESQ